MRLIPVLLGVIWLLAGCEPQGERCRKCGMFVEDHPRWIAGLINESGQAERFCCPRCMFAYWRSPQGAGSHDGWATEYYSQEKLPVDDLFFVVGSDVLGPMGKSLVPVRGRAEAQQFQNDHHGTAILTADEITGAVLREIAGAAPE